MSSPEKPTDKACCGGCSGETPKGPYKPSRRDFLLAFGLGLNAVAGAMIGIPILGYALSAVATKYNLRPVSLGPVSKFPEGTTRLASYKNPYKVKWDGGMDEIPCWVRRIKGDEFQVFAINCTHLGCPVRWFEESKLFMCPCHGGAFYEDGAHAAGPPPRGLYTYQHEVKNGELFIDAGFQFTLATENA
jgi:Rieske Fe-S protein